MEKQAKEESPLIILGIDPGTCITGYGIISYGHKEQKALDFGCIRPPATTVLSKRYLIIFEGLSDLIKKYKPDVVSIETQFVYKNPSSAIKLGMARGMGILAAAKNDLPIYEYTPKKAKLAVVGNGAASKEQVQKMIQVLFNLKDLPEPEDAADALALALCHGHSINSPTQLQGTPV
jgi:crossover junction endodeoxyribonuclease RuvC